MISFSSPATRGPVFEAPSTEGQWQRGLFHGEGKLTYGDPDGSVVPGGRGSGPASAVEPVEMVSAGTLDLVHLVLMNNVRSIPGHLRGGSYRHPSYRGRSFLHEE